MINSPLLWLFIASCRPTVTDDTGFIAGCSQAERELPDALAAGSTVLEFPAMNAERSRHRLVPLYAAGIDGSNLWRRNREVDRVTKGDDTGRHSELKKAQGSIARPSCLDGRQRRDACRAAATSTEKPFE